MVSMLGWLTPGPLLLFERPRLGMHNHLLGETMRKWCDNVAEHGGYVALSVGTSDQVL